MRWILTHYFLLYWQRNRLWCNFSSRTVRVQLEPKHHAKVSSAGFVSFNPYCSRNNCTGACTHWTLVEAFFSWGLMSDWFWLFLTVFRQVVGQQSTRTMRDSACKDATHSSPFQPMCCRLHPHLRCSRSFEQNENRKSWPSCAVSLATSTPRSACYAGDAKLVCGVSSKGVGPLVSWIVEGLSDGFTWSKRPVLLALSIWPRCYRPLSFFKTY